MSDPGTESGARPSGGSITYLFGPGTVRGRADRAGHHIAQRTLSEFENGENDDPDPSLARS